MKYVWIALVVIGLILILAGMIILLRRRWAKKQVQTRTDDQKCKDLNRALEPFGFQYDIQKDLFCANMYSGQRSLGYCKFYDESAPMLNMVIDSEPFYFWYQGYYWLIEVWKGQYGITTGAEVGIYRKMAEPTENPEELFYESVPDSERLPMSIVLKKHNRTLITRSEYHWWLTGFKLGEFSQKEELVVQIRLTFPTTEMRNAFVEALQATGYKAEEIYIDRFNVTFEVEKPKTKQPKVHGRLVLWWVQWQNKKNCRRYFRATKTFRRTIDKVDYIGFCFPGLYKILIGAGKSRSMEKGYIKMRKKGLIKG